MRGHRVAKEVEPAMQEEPAAFFEGTEKKFELVVAPGAPSLLGLGDAFWERLCRAAGATVLSRIGDDRGRAFLLSESSLLVFERRVVMITCGRTTLHRAVLHLLERVSSRDVAFFVYQRKNEAFPHEQRTSFFEDVRSFQDRLPGRAFRFGAEDEHHLLLFHLDRPFTADPADATLEILMYGIDPEVAASFDVGRAGSKRAARHATGIVSGFDGFRIDDHLFAPSGYSLNGMRGETYYTVHVTPETCGSYASFETNASRARDPDETVAAVVRAFRPRSYDVVRFDRVARGCAPSPGYRARAAVAHDLACGYGVHFSTCDLPPAAPERPTELRIAGTGVEAIP